MILALDLGTRVGYAACTRLIGGRPAEIYKGTEYFAADDGIAGTRFLAFARWLNVILFSFQPTRIVYEAAYIMPNAQATRIFFGLTAFLQAVCAERYLDAPVPVNALSIKKYATGDGHASKRQMLTAVRERWCSTLGDDHVDVCRATKSARKAKGRDKVPGIPCYHESHDMADAVALLMYDLARQAEERAA